MFASLKVNFNLWLLKFWTGFDRLYELMFHTNHNCIGPPLHWFKITTCVFQIILFNNYRLKLSSSKANKSAGWTVTAKDTRMTLREGNWSLDWGVEFVVTTYGLLGGVSVALTMVWYHINFIQWKKYDWEECAWKLLQGHNNIDTM